MLSARVRCVVASLFVLLLVLVAAGIATGEIPGKINYQGKLVDTSTGEPLSGTQTMVFRLYDAADSGTELWAESLDVSVDSTGIFSLILGGTTPIAIPFDGPVWLEVEVVGEVLSPRREIVSVPYAFRAAESDHSASADSLGGYGAEDFSGTGHVHDERYVQGDSLSAPGSLNSAANPVDWSRLKNVPAGFADGVDNEGGVAAGGGWVDDGTVVRLENASDSTGIGTAAPQEKLHVTGTVRMEGFSMPEGSTPGHVLTSDSDGEGTWQAPIADGHSLDSDGGVIEDVVYVENTGDVGIGTTDPGTRLHVYEDANTQVGIMIDNPNTGSLSGERITFRDEQGDLAAIIAYDPANPTYPNAVRIFNNRSGGTIGLATGGGAGDDLHVGASGNIGIKTSAPEEALDVNGTARMTGFELPTGAAGGHVLTSDGSGAGTWQAPQGGDGHSLDGMGGVPADAVYVDATGNVGVGTTSPAGGIHLYRNENGSTKVTIENPHVGESSTESLLFADENGEAAGITLTDDGFAPRPRNMRIFNDRPLGNMTFSTNGLNRVWISSAGSVGIGTANPFQKLEVAGETAVWASIRASGTNSIAGVGIANDANSWEIDVRGDMGDAFVIRDNSPGNSRMVIDDSGNVGFNTAAPANALHLHKTSATSCNLQVTNSSTGSAAGDGLKMGVDNLRNAYVTNQENTNLYLGSNGDIDLTIASDGDVGIGTNSPTAASVQIYRGGATACNMRFTNGTTGPLSGDGLDLGIGAAGDAYLYNGENTSLSFSTNATTRLRIAADGRIGIGETSPSSLLDLKGSDPYIDLNTTGTVTGMRLQKNGTTKWEMAWNEGSAYMYLWSGGGVGTSFVVEDATGDVGIGTSDPTSKLHINGSSGHSQLRLQDSYTPSGTFDSAGNTGDIAWDNNFIYVKTGAGWKRAALSTF